MRCSASVPPILQPPSTSPCLPAASLPSLASLPGFEDCKVSIGPTAGAVFTLAFCTASQPCQASRARGLQGFNRAHSWCGIHVSILSSQPALPGQQYCWACKVARIVNIAEPARLPGSQCCQACNAGRIAILLGLQGMAGLVRLPGS